MDKRKAVWAECWNCVQEYLKELALYHADKTNVIVRDRSKQASKRVCELMHEDIENRAVLSQEALWSAAQVDEVRQAFAEHLDAGKDDLMIRLKGHMKHAI